MGTELVSDIVWRVRQLVHDSAGSRWDDTEMIKWLNDGTKEVVILKPSANSVRQTLNLDVGSLQELPVGAVALLRITHNATGESCRLVDQDRLDATDPTWRAAPMQAVAEHYMYEPTTPMEYQVYPPNNGSGQLEAVVSMTPATVDAVTDTFPLPDIWTPAMVDYLLYRAYSKHSKFAGNEQRAAAAYARFQSQLGVKFQMEGALNPNLTDEDPNTGVQ